MTLCPPQQVDGQDGSEISHGKCLACGHGYPRGGAAARCHTVLQSWTRCLLSVSLQGRAPLGRNAHPNTPRNHGQSSTWQNLPGCVSKLWGMRPCGGWVRISRHATHQHSSGPSSARWTGSTCTPTPELPRSVYSKAQTAQFPWAPPPSPPVRNLPAVGRVQLACPALPMAASNSALHSDPSPSASPIWPPASSTHICSPVLQDCQGSALCGVPQPLSRDSWETRLPGPCSGDPDGSI